MKRRNLHSNLKLTAVLRSLRKYTCLPPTWLTPSKPKSQAPKHTEHCRCSSRAHFPSTSPSTYTTTTRTTSPFFSQTPSTPSQRPPQYSQPSPPHLPGNSTSPSTIPTNSPLALLRGCLVVRPQRLGVSSLQSDPRSPRGIERRRRSRRRWSRRSGLRCRWNYTSAVN